MHTQKYCFDGNVLSFFYLVDYLCGGKSLEKIFELFKKFGLRFYRGPSTKIQNKRLNSMEVN